MIRSPGWFTRIRVLAGTFQLPPSNYNADPLGWDAIFGPDRARHRRPRLAQPLHDDVLVPRPSLCRLSQHVRKNPPFYLALMGVVAYFTLASHLLNGGEQGRMRYTIEPIYFLWSAYCSPASASASARDSLAGLAAPAGRLATLLKPPTQDAAPIRGKAHFSGSPEACIHQNPRFSGFFAVKSGFSPCKSRFSGFWTPKIRVFRGPD